MRVISGFKKDQIAYLLTGDVVIVKDVLVDKDKVLYQVYNSFNTVTTHTYDQLCESVFDLVKKLIDLGTDLSEIKRIVNRI